MTQAQSRTPGGDYPGDDSMADKDTAAKLEATFREAEQTGLQMAIKGRIVALVLIGIFLVVSRAGSDISTSIGYALVVSGFALLGALHYWLIGSRFDFPWVKYVFISLDIAILSLLIATQPLYDSIDLPLSINFRSTQFQYYFVVLGVAAFSFSPGLVLWSGVAGVVGWLGAFAWVTRDMSEALSWGDIPPNPTDQQVLDVLFNANFIGTGSRIQEAIFLLVVAILIAIVMLRARRTVRRQLELDLERSAISEIFGQFVPRAIADALIRDRGVLRPLERDATILFIDIADFTAMTEAQGAAQIVRVLNAYFDEVTRIISNHDGVITQFQGDAILATFNVPLEDSQHAAKAVRAAREIQRLLQNQTFEGEKIRSRIGICTGPVVAGNIGGGGRQNYTVHGDTVNLAARLESCNKEYATEVLIAQSCLDLALAVIDDNAFRRVGEISVRGFSEPVAIYTPKDSREAATSRL